MANPKNKSTVDVSDLRDAMIEDQFETEFGVGEVAAHEVDDKRIFGLTAGERMILSVIFFLAVSVVSVALLLLTNTVVLP